MKLNREIIKGTIKEINWDRVVAIGLTIGLVGVSAKMIDLNMEKRSAELNHYSSYSEQVESVFDVDITSPEKEAILNDMEANLDLVNAYNATSDDSEKERLLTQMYNTRALLKGDALYLIKIDEAKKEGRSPEEYHIRKCEGDSWEIYREENGINQYFSSLNRPARRLVNTATALYEASKENPEELVKLYEDTVKQSAAYVGKTSEKSDKAK